MKTKLFLFAIVFIITCKKEKPSNSYPACFKEMQSPVYTNVNSCGGVFMAVQLDAHRLVAISLKEINLGLATQCKSFDIAHYPNDIDINYYTYNHDPDSVYFNYCSDIAFPDSMFGSKISWKAVSGTVTAVVSKERKYRMECEGCLASVIINNVRFVKENSTIDTVINEIVIKDKSVGFCIP